MDNMIDTDNKYCIFIRHGKCSYNKDKYESPDEVLLTNDGIIEIKKILNQIKIFKPEIIYTSPIKRAFESASIIKMNIGIELKIVEDLKERYFNIIKGMSYEDIKKNYSNKILNKLLTNSESLNLPGEETIKKAQLRVTRCITRILIQNYNRFIIVSHGGPHSWLCCHLLNIPLKECRIFTLNTGHFSIFKFSNKLNFLKLITLNSLKLKNELHKTSIEDL